jgi:translation initiation factor 2 alpha subunit (eIF-2alpha)
MRTEITKQGGEMNESQIEQIVESILRERIAKLENSLEEAYEKRIIQLENLLEEAYGIIGHEEEDERRFHEDVREYFIKTRPSREER